jgi:hypothetical protein
MPSLNRLFYGLNIFERRKGTVISNDSLDTLALLLFLHLFSILGFHWQPMLLSTCYYCSRGPMTSPKPLDNKGSLANASA